METKLCYCWECRAITHAQRHAVHLALHLIPSICTLGLWLVVLLLCYLVRDPWRCVDCHAKRVSTGNREQVQQWVSYDFARHDAIDAGEQPAPGFWNWLDRTL